MKFLLNTAVIEIGAEDSPFRDRAFPLSQQQYRTVGPNDLIELLAQEFRQNPRALETALGRIKRLLWMLHEKSKANALRLSWEGGTQGQLGLVPELAFAGLISMARNGSLTMAAVDQAVWSQLQR
jgi:N-acetylmuramic acid 6-phosphate (MurNAc-6-P) etherase